MPIFRNSIFRNSTILKNQSRPFEKNQLEVEVRLASNYYLYGWQIGATDVNILETTTKPVHTSVYVHGPYDCLLQKFIKKSIESGFLYLLSRYYLLRRE